MEVLDIIALCGALNFLFTLHLHKQVFKDMVATLEEHLAEPISPQELMLLAHRFLERLPPDCFFTFEFLMNGDVYDIGHVYNSLYSEHMLCTQLLMFLVCSHIDLNGKKEIVVPDKANQLYPYFKSKVALLWGILPMIHLVTSIGNIAVPVPLFLPNDLKVEDWVFVKKSFRQFVLLLHQKLRSQPLSLPDSSPLEPQNHTVAAENPQTPPIDNADDDDVIFVKIVPSKQRKSNKISHDIIRNNRGPYRLIRGSFINSNTVGPSRARSPRLRNILWQNTMPRDDPWSRVMHFQASDFPEDTKDGIEKIIKSEPEN